MESLLSYGNIVLRALEPDDVEMLYNWENNMEIWELSNTKTPFSKYVLAKYIQESARDIYETRQLRLIIETRDHVPVGAIDLFEFEPYHQRAGVGILIHKTEHRHKGYATDALAALSNYALEVLGLKQLYANIAADNPISINLFEKAGFQQSGLKKNWLKTFTGWKDEVLLQKMLA